MTAAVSEPVVTTQLWNTVSGVAEKFGVEVFDIDLPSGASHGGVLRVYLSRPKLGGVVSSDGSEEPRGGVSFEDCVHVAKQLLDLDEQQSFIPDGCVLEVSSPGINRRLRLPQHFFGAVGERVRVKFRAEGGSYRVVLGTLSAVEDNVLLIVDEQSKQNEQVRVPIVDIKEARVDFKF
jgi:ribosome maturation factor RimP